MRLGCLQLHLLVSCACPSMRVCTVQLLDAEEGISTWAWPAPDARRSMVTKDWWQQWPHLSLLVEGCGCGRQCKKMRNICKAITSGHTIAEM